jgi:hypothetical protein
MNYRRTQHKVITMKTYTVGIVLIIWILLIPSCDLIIPPDGSGLIPGNLLITIHFDITNPGYWHWVDEVHIYDDRRATITRLEGDPIPVSSRMLSEIEFDYLGDLFGDFNKLEDSYLRDDYTETWIYTITYYGDGLRKTVKCDNSVYDYSNEILRPIVRFVNEIRISLIGEDKYAGKLEFSLHPEKAVVNLDEDIVLQYRVRNISGKNVELIFPNQQQLGYKVYRDGKLIHGYPWFFLPAFSSWNIPAGSVREQKISWPQTIYFDEYEFSDKKAKSGVYTIIQYLLDSNSPYRATEITITENGNSPLQARAIRSILRPGLLIYELNNRISDEFVFEFNINKPIGYKIISTENGSVVRADSTETPGSARIAIKPFGDYIYPIEWNGRDSAGNILNNGRYILEMWMIGQDAKYRAIREFWVYNL